MKSWSFSKCSNFLIPTASAKSSQSYVGYFFCVGVSFSDSNTNGNHVPPFFRCSRMAPTTVLEASVVNHKLADGSGNKSTAVFTVSFLALLYAVMRSSVYSISVLSHCPWWPDSTSVSLLMDSVAVLENGLHALSIPI